MRHVEPEVLALLALGEEVAKPDELAHLQGCTECGSELINLKHAARVGRSALGAGDLIAPPARVWDRIAEELELDPVPSGAPDPSAPPELERTPYPAPAATAGRPLPLPADSARPSAEPASEPIKAPIPLRRRVPLLAAAAAAAILVAGGAVTWQLLRPVPPTVVASAELEPFPAWPDAEGSALLEETSAGERVVRVSLEAPDETDGFREVWLITSDATRLVSLGVLEGTEGTFAVPSGIDTDSYDLVDISEEPLDGDPDHSGDSIVRGQLDT